MDLEYWGLEHENESGTTISFDVGPGGLLKGSDWSSNDDSRFQLLRHILGVPLSCDRLHVGGGGI